MCRRNCFASKRNKPRSWLRFFEKCSVEVELCTNLHKLSDFRNLSKKWNKHRAITHRNQQITWFSFLWNLHPRMKLFREFYYSFKENFTEQWLTESLKTRTASLYLYTHTHTVTDSTYAWSWLNHQPRSCICNKLQFPECTDYRRVA